MSQAYIVFQLHNASILIVLIIFNVIAQTQPLAENAVVHMQHHPVT
jgi:hypothetical protein